MFPLTADERQAGSPGSQAAAPKTAPFHVPAFHPELQVWVEDAVRIGLPDAGFWTACRRGIELAALSCVPESLRGELADTKVLGVMQGVLLAVAARRFGECDFLNTPEFGGPRPTAGPPERQQFADFAIASGNEYEDRVRRMPRHSEFAELHDYDRRQFVNALRTAQRLAGGEAMLRRVNGDPFFAAGLNLMASATIDVMGSPGFDSSEIGALREALWRAQYQFRSAELATAWERERQEAAPDTELRSGGGLPDRWRRCRGELLLMQPSLKTVDLGRLVAGVDALAGWPRTEFRPNRLAAAGLGETETAPEGADRHRGFPSVQPRPPSPTQQNGHA